MTFTVFGDEFYTRYVEGHSLSAPALAVHVVALLKCVACINNGTPYGTLSAELVSGLMRQLGVRNRAATIQELIDAGLWTDLGNTTFQVDMTHQETADQVARKADGNSQRQADFRERNSRCKAGDHSMCAGTKRRCQGKSNAVTSTPLSSPVLSSPFPARDKDEDEAEMMINPAAPDGSDPAADAPEPTAVLPETNALDDPSAGSDADFDIDYWRTREDVPDEQYATALQREVCLIHKRYQGAPQMLDVKPVKDGIIEIRLKPKFYGWVKYFDYDRFNPLEHGHERAMIRAAYETVDRLIEDHEFELANEDDTRNDEQWPARIRVEADSRDQLISDLSSRLFADAAEKSRNEAAREYVEEYVKLSATIPAT